MENWSVNWSKKDWNNPKNIISRQFYARDTIEVARDLLGKVLVVSSQAGITAGRIVETEAYQGNDPASHSCRGRTPRSEIMFGPPGVAYVYFIYGMYEMFNVVTENEGQAGAVLIRALEPLFGEALMKKRRNVEKSGELLRGPGKLCRAMDIRMSHRGASVRGPEIFILNGPSPKVSASPRVGIRQGTDKFWRFFETGSAFVSRAPQDKLAKVLPPKIRSAKRSA